MGGEISIEDRMLGGLLGVCIGDAIGVPVEGASRACLKRAPVRGFGYGTSMRGVPDGWWSDDSSLTLCLAESLCRAGGVLDLELIAESFCAWLYEGYWTPGGRAFGIGGTTARALERIRNGGDPRRSGERGEFSNGNGSLMRILPMAFYLYGGQEDDAYAPVHAVSSITHAHPRSLMACGMYVQMALRLMSGLDIRKSYALMRGEASSRYAEKPYGEEIKHFHRVLDASLPRVTEDSIRSSGYVVDTLEAALWCLLVGGSFEESVLKAVNLGGDTDTTAAIIGGLCGVYYGLGGIPPAWISVLVRSDDILSLGRRICRTFIG